MLNRGYNDWKKKFENEYEEKQKQWEAQYSGFLETKRDWVNDQYLLAANSALMPSLAQSGANVTALINAATEKTTSIAQMQLEEMDVGLYVETLLGNTNLGKH